MMTAKFLYRSYSFFYSVSFHLKRHVTPAGTLMMAIFAITFVFGLNMFKTTLYQMMSISFCTLGVSAGLSLYPFRARIRVKHFFPEYATEGQAALYSVEITNLGSTPQKGILLFEDLADPRPDLKTLLTKKEPYEHIRNAWDRKTLYYRWAWLILKTGKANFRPIRLPDLPPRETIRVTSEFIPNYRGYIHFTGVTLARPDILGLFMRLFRMEETHKILVLPKRYELDPPDLKPRRHYHPGGVSLASSVGNSDEFMSLRYYRPGDPMRNIHWRTFARTGKLVIKEFEDEFFVRHALILDTAVPPDKDAVFEEAVRIAASYAVSIRPHDAILDLMLAGEKIYSFSSGRGLGRPEKILEILSCTEPCRDKTLLALKGTLESGIKKMSGAVCIFTDWKKEHEEIAEMLHEALLPVFIIVLAGNASEKESLISKTRAMDRDIRVVQMGKVPEEISAP